MSERNNNNNLSTAETIAHELELCYLKLQIKEDKNNDYDITFQTERFRNLVK